METTTNVQHLGPVFIHSPPTLAWSVACESTAQRLASPCLDHQPTVVVFASTALNSPAHSTTARAYKVRCAFVKSCDKNRRLHHTITPSPACSYTRQQYHPSPHNTCSPPTPLALVGGAHLGPFSLWLLCCMRDPSLRLSLCAKRRDLECCELTPQISPRNRPGCICLYGVVG